MKITNNSILITGGTGSFGVALLHKIINLNPKEIRIFSRDEKKQFDLKRRFPQSFIHWFIGDVKDPSSLIDAVRGVDIIFHAAALKQIPTLEDFPIEATKTNVLGTENVLQAAIQFDVKKVILLSTDKSIQPISAMGLTKALMEKNAISKARKYRNPIINIVRYGNVIGSRGSVIPLFIEAIKNQEEITLFNPDSSRFLITIEEAISLVLIAIESGKSGEIFVPNCQSATLDMIVKAIESILNLKAVKKISSLRTGDKFSEMMIDIDEFPYARISHNFFVIDGLKSKIEHNQIKSFNSQDKLMSFDQLLTLVKVEIGKVKH
jgi:UDP-N-acetylglucosamine 4,6-dehydratase/5-epimerase